MHRPGATLESTLNGVHADPSLQSDSRRAFYPPAHRPESSSAAPPHGSYAMPQERKKTHPPLPTPTCPVQARSTRSTSSPASWPSCPWPPTGRAGGPKSPPSGSTCPPSTPRTRSSPSRPAPRCASGRAATPLVRFPRLGSGRARAECRQCAPPPLTTRSDQHQTPAAPGAFVTVHHALADEREPGVVQERGEGNSAWQQAMGPAPGRSSSAVQGVQGSEKDWCGGPVRQPLVLKPRATRATQKTTLTAMPPALLGGL